MAEFDTKLRLDIERPNTYMRENGLTKKQFCNLCKVTEEEFDKIYTEEFEFGTDYYSKNIHPILMKVIKTILLKLK